MQRVFSLFLTALLLASPAYAQYAAGTTGADSVLAGVSATEVEVTGPGVPYHEKADINSQILGRLYRDTPLVAYPAQGMFYAVGSRGEGHLGYVRARFLRVSGYASDNPRGRTRQAVHVQPRRGVQVEVQSGPKSPTTAGVLSFFIPGAGQVYAGRTGKGVALLAIAGAAPIAGYATIDFGDGWDDEPNFTSAWIGAGVGAVAWLVSVATAPSDARAYNEEHVQRFAGAEVEPAATTMAGETSYGLQVSMQF